MGPVADRCRVIAQDEDPEIAQRVDFGENSSTTFSSKSSMAFTFPSMFLRVPSHRGFHMDEGEVPVPQGRKRALCLAHVIRVGVSVAPSMRTTSRPAQTAIPFRRSTAEIMAPRIPYFSERV